ncbi:MAG TPA: SRPBCC domain-containing protein [Pirellulales bacterium]|nr:SRPBCC domain-containing protein [Pirellulales bacterium]
MKDQPTVTVRVVHRFEASAEQVFDAWLDPATASKFLFATGPDTMVRAEIDARPGGSFSLVDRRDGEDVEHKGEYLEIARPERLVFDFLVPKYSNDVTRVVIGIARSGSGCELTLDHEHLNPRFAAGAESGWTAILNGLESVLG